MLSGKGVMRTKDVDVIPPVIAEFGVARVIKMCVAQITYRALHKYLQSSILVNLQSYTAQWDSEIKSSSEYQTSMVAANRCLRTLVYYLYLNITVQFMCTIRGI